ncbi:MAG: hypothetical protein D6679_02095 [Candidatus Hydrogenedentota bacterium]|nr:MAG: hypothetical protein D6679_02095 [Candidatus Hydrogenedentota bacterium]
MLLREAGSTGEVTSPLRLVLFCGKNFEKNRLGGLIFGGHLFYRIDVGFLAGIGRENETARADRTKFQRRGLG